MYRMYAHRRYRIYNIQGSETPEGLTIMTQYGCNGELHAERRVCGFSRIDAFYPDKIFDPEARGKCEGKCDMLCCQMNLGEFYYDPWETKYELFRVS